VSVHNSTAKEKDRNEDILDSSYRDILACKDVDAVMIA
jgi:hypothetical protein